MNNPKALQTRTPLWVKLSFVAYVAVMLWLLFGQRLYYYISVNIPPTAIQYNLLPFETVVSFVTDLLDPTAPHYRKHTAVTNLIGNVVLFIPLGIFLPCLFASCRRFSRLVLTDALIIFGVEIVQLITLLGSFDTDDLLFNIVGGVIGFWLYRIILRYFGRFLGLTSATS